jgi:hypothetical protein
MITLSLSTPAAVILAVLYGIARLDRLMIAAMALREDAPKDADKVVAALAKMPLNSISEQK